MQSRAYILLLLALSACCPKVVNERSDTTIINTVVRWKDTTIFVKVPEEHYINVTADTSSYLATSFAESSASVSNGLFTHTLNNIRGASIPAIVKVPYTTISSTQSRFISQTITKEVAKPLAWWQKALMWLGAGMLCAVLVISVYKLVKK